MMAAAYRSCKAEEPVVAWCDRCGELAATTWRPRRATAQPHQLWRGVPVSAEVLGDRGV